MALSVPVYAAQEGPLEIRMNGEGQFTICRCGNKDGEIGEKKKVFNFISERQTGHPKYK